MYHLSSSQACAYNNFMLALVDLTRTLPFNT